MENNLDSLNELTNDNSTLKLSKKAIQYLSETEKWTKFLAILGFCFIGLIVLMAFFIGTFFSKLGVENEAMPFSGAIFSVIYLIMAIIYFFPIYYLFQFATNMKDALGKKDNLKLDRSLENLKSHYKFVGILTAIILGLYIFFGLFALLGAMLV